MLNVKKSFTSENDTKRAVESIIASIRQSGVKFVIFFSSTKYDFALASRMIKDAFSDAEVIGCTTSGEFSPNGITQGNITAMSIAADDFTPATVVIKDISQKAILSKDEIIRTASKAGIDIDDPDANKKGFGIVLIDGLSLAEEKVLSVLNAVLKDFPVVGGSAADDMKFDKTYVSANGEVYTNAAVVTFIKTSKKVFTYKENIYAPTETEFKVTKVDMNTRIMYEINNKPAVEEYARLLGLKPEELTVQHLADNPMGRQFGNNTWIITPFRILEGGAIYLCAQVMPNSTVKLLKPIDTIEEAKKTVQSIKTNMPNVKAVLAFNCTMRYLRFNKENSNTAFCNELSKLGEVIGFNCYGEQIGKQHVNQTLTLVAIGE